MVRNRHHQRIICARTVSPLMVPPSRPSGMRVNGSEVDGDFLILGSYLENSGASGALSFCRLPRSSKEYRLLLRLQFTSAAAAPPQERFVWTSADQAFERQHI
jgi:hypothetical protein